LVHLLPRLSAAMRCTLWWLVGAQLLAGMVWHAPLQLRLLSPPAVERTLDAAVVSTPAPANLLVNATASVAAAPHENRAPTPASPAAPRWLAHAPLALALLWLAGLLAQLPAIVRQGWQARRLLRESTPVANASLQAQCATQAHALGLRRAPALRASAAIASPQVLGWRRPTILLPTGQAMREYSLAREAACDAQVLAQPDIEPQRYGRLLLQLGVAHPLRAGLAGASPSFGNLKRRLTMLQHTPMLPRQRVQGWLLVAVIAIAGVLPYRVTAAAPDQPAPPARSASTAWMAPPPPAPPAPPPATAPALPAMVAPAAPP